MTMLRRNGVICGVIGFALVTVYPPWLASLTVYAADRKIVMSKQPAFPLGHRVIIVNAEETGRYGFIWSPPQRRGYSVEYGHPGALDSSYDRAAIYRDPITSELSYGPFAYRDEVAVEYEVDYNRLITEYVVLAVVIGSSVVLASRSFRAKVQGSNGE
jgi:hypothetical protein